MTTLTDAPSTPTDPTRHAPRQAEVVAALGAVLPAHALLWQNEDTVPYECDGLTAYRQRPLAVALPETGSRWPPCCGLPRPGRAGGGARRGHRPVRRRHAHAEGVTLALAKFNRILQIDRPAAPRWCSAGAQPGHQRGRRPAGPVLRARPVQPDRLHHRRQRGRELRRRALPEVRPDRAQRAQGAGLHRRGRSGRVRRRRLDAPGLDLLAVLIGSEGMLAVVTEVTVKLTPKPQLARCIMASFDDVRRPATRWPPSSPPASSRPAWR
jgi:glycolate oxidase